MLALELVRDADGIRHRTARPVVAVKAETVAFLDHAATRTPPDDTGTIEELTRRGWCLVSQATATGALVIDDSGEIVEHDDVMLPDIAHRLVACPWPAEEDAERLAPHWRALERDLDRREAFQASKAAR